MGLDIGSSLTTSAKFLALSMLEICRNDSFTKKFEFYCVTLLASPQWCVVATATHPPLAQ